MVGRLLGTRGGTAILWNEDFVGVTDVITNRYTMSAKITLKESGKQFKLTNVYGPTKLARKPAFLRELKNAKPNDNASWLVLGDFNLIYRARDKNNNHLNRAMMARFRDALNTAELKEIHLQNKIFTWRNERANPTLVRLDRFFCNAAWDVDFGSHTLQALATALSDHSLLLLANVDAPRRPRTFRFENFWIKMPGFHDTVVAAWSEPKPHTEPMHRLTHKLQITAMRLREWSSRLLSEAVTAAYGS